jgi:membrane fusion protein, multidrug efflux system
VTRGMKRLLLLVVIPVIAALGAGYVYLSGGRYVHTDNAYVKAEKVAISAEISGRVHEVFVQENQAVTAGQPLFRLDPEPFMVAIAKAEARVAQVRTDFAALKASYRAKQAEITLATTKHTFAKRDQQRQADLVAKSFISAARFEESQQTADLAIQQINALEQDLHRIAETLGGSIDTPVEKHPTYRSALAELNKVKLDLAHTEVRASLPGNVNKPPRLGQFVTAGSVAMALVVSGNLWIEANYTETDLTYVHPGQPVVIRIDTYPGVTWRGTVDSLSPATSAEFSVLPAQNATGNWVKITQRVPVRIKIDADADMPQLRAGLSAVVEIDTGHRRRLFGFAL